MKQTTRRVFRCRIVAIDLRPPARTAAFIALFIIPAALMTAESLRIAAASLLARSFGAPSLRLAVSIAPGDPDFHASLGSYYLFSAGGLDPNHAVRQFRLATRLSPGRADLWQDLAKACQAAGDSRCAANAFARALRLSPMAPRAWWVAGVNLVIAGRPEKALPYFRRLLVLDPGYARAVSRVTSDLNY